MEKVCGEIGIVNSIRVFGRPVRQLQEDGLVFLLFHGRDSAATSMNQLAAELARPTDAVLVPLAPGGSWYPLSLYSPLEQNEPMLTQSIQRVASLIAILEGQNISRDRIVLAGFSQGACLVAHFLTRNPARYGAALIFSGCCIGTAADELESRTGSLDRTPVLLSASRSDPYIRWTRIEETAHLLKEVGADVSVLGYPGESHEITATEVKTALSILPTKASL